MKKYFLRIAVVGGLLFIALFFIPMPEEVGTLLYGLGAVCLVGGIGGYFKSDD